MLKKLLITALCICILSTTLSSCNLNPAPEESRSENSSESGSETTEQTTDIKESGEISAEEALEIAKKYWESSNIEENGYLVARAVSNDAPDSVYVFVMKHLVQIGDHSHYSTIDEVWVDKTTGEAMPPYDAKPGLMFDYDEVLRCYKYAVDFYNYGEFETVDDVINSFNVHYGSGFLDDRERQWFSKIATSGYTLYPGRNGSSIFENNPACGYAKKDLNGDGIEELVLLNADYTVVALFSMHEGRPVLLDYFWNRKKCMIDGNGRIVIFGSSAADVSSVAFYRIADGGESLEALFEYGLDGHEWVDDVAVIKYYKIEDGEKKYITPDEYNDLSSGRGKYYEYRPYKQVTREDSGLQFKSLFVDAFTFSNYYKILDSLRFMTSMYNDYKLALATREETEYRYDLSTEENIKMYEALDKLVQTYYPPAMGASCSAEKAFAYAIKDLNGDGVDELVLIEGETYSVFAILTEKNGKIVFDNSYSFERPSGEVSMRLNYWISTVGLNLKPLFPESNWFSLEHIKEDAKCALDNTLAELKYGNVWVPEISDRLDKWTDYVVNTPSGEKKISDIKDLRYAFVDMDGDSIDELIVDCGIETVVLHYLPSSPSSINIYRIGTDELHSINTASPIEFVSFEELFSDRLSPIDAVRIGEQHWEKYQSSDEYFIDFSTQSRYIDSYGDPIKTPDDVYILQKISSDNFKCIDEIWINIYTGEITMYAK